MVIIGLGSNIGDRLGYLVQAVRAISALLADMRLSRIFESAAILPENATPDMDLPYYNMAVRGETHLSPEALLAQLKLLENEIGREKNIRWGPRQIDMDILAMDGLRMDTPQLTIPHTELLNRDFAVLPFCDVAPDWIHPVVRKTITAIRDEKNYALNPRLRDTGLSLHA